jgi:hypothetical protein
MRVGLIQQAAEKRSLKVEVRRFLLLPSGLLAFQQPVSRDAPSAGDQLMAKQ